MCVRSMLVGLLPWAAIGISAGPSLGEDQDTAIARPAGNPWEGDLERVASLPQVDWTHAVAFSPDGSLLAAGGPRNGGRPGWITTWRTADWSEAGRYDAEGIRVCSLLFTPDGKRLLAGGMDEPDVVVVDLSTDEQRLLHQSEDYGRRSDLILSPDGALLATAGAGGIELWRTATWEHFQTIAFTRDRIWSLAPLPATEWRIQGGWFVAASGQGEIVVPYPNGLREEDRDPIEGKDVCFTGIPLWKVDRNRSVGDAWSFELIASSPDGRSIAVCAFDGAENRRLRDSIRLYDVERPDDWRLRAEIPLGEDADRPSVLGFSPDGLTVVCGGGRAELQRFRADTGERAGSVRLAESPFGVGDIAWSGNRRMALACMPTGSVLVFEPAERD